MKTSFIKSFMAKIFTVSCFLFTTVMQSQNVSISATGVPPDNSAGLDIVFTNKGLLIPRVALTSATDAATIPSPANSLLVYNLGTGGLSPAGYYYNAGTTTSPNWVRLLPSTGTGGAWLITGNAGTIDGTNFIGTTDAVPFNIKVNNQKSGRIDMNHNTILGYYAGNNLNATASNNNTAIGGLALYSLISGNANTAVGRNALYSYTGSYATAVGFNALYNCTGGNNNTAVGYLAMFANTTGDNNTAVGLEALQSNTTGSNNTALGLQALWKNTTGSNNVAIGEEALLENTTGFENVGIGYRALLSNTTGTANVAIGPYALNTNTTGLSNVAIGHSALTSNLTGIRNIGIGTESLFSNTSGNNNIAVGYRTLYSNTTGNYNTAIGFAALNSNTNGYNNIAIGTQALNSTTTGPRNVSIGDFACRDNTTGYNNVAIGYSALETNTVGIYNTCVGFDAGNGGTPGCNLNYCTIVGALSYPQVTRNNVIMLGYMIGNAQCTGNNQVLLGNTAITQIRAQVTGITAYSDQRIKYNIKEDVKGLEFIMKLKPVTFNENPEIMHKIWGTPDSLLKTLDHSDIMKRRQIGFLAQDVEKAAKECGFEFPGIDVPSNEKEFYKLRYTDFIMPLVKAVQEQQEQIQFLNKQIEILNKQIKKN